MAQVDCDARLLLLQFAGGLFGALVDVHTRLSEDLLGECHHLVIRDGSRGVVAHLERDFGRVEAAVVAATARVIVRCVNRSWTKVVMGGGRSAPAAVHARDGEGVQLGER